jgi:hypothetical protein
MAGRGPCCIFAARFVLCFHCENSKEVDHLLDDWTREARHDLLALPHPQGTWGYKKGAPPFAEPSALASLGLLASGNGDSAARDLADAQSTGEWIAAIQRADGSVPVSPDIPTSAWTTPLALIFWSNFPGFETYRRRARNWLIRVEGRTLPRNDPGAKLFGHDSTAVGWPWVHGTHSWVEPTAMAVLALCREGLSQHRRVLAGIHLILDRSLKSGGWNYGNPEVFGRELRPQPGPTAVALLALAAHHNDSPECGRAIDYLRQALREVRSGVSLGWGVLALHAWDACPRDALSWLGESYRRYRARPDQAVSLALLLLAASEPGLDLLVKSTRSAVTESLDESRAVDAQRNPS